MAHFEIRFEGISPSIWTTLARIDELKGRWSAGVRLSPQALGRLKRSVLVTSTGASTRIEGARLSDEEIEKLIRGVAIQKFTDRDEQEVKGYYELLQNIFDSWEDLRFGENLIKHFHKELLKYVPKDEPHRGNYKTQENKVHMVDEAGRTLEVLFDTTPAYLAPKEMQELVEWTDQALVVGNPHSLLVIGNFVVEFLKIHPFQDGNGRLSRILTNLLMLKAGYAHVPYVSHEKFIEDNKSDYYVALRTSQKTLSTDAGDISVWLSFFLGILLKQSAMAITLLAGEDLEKLLSPRQLVVWRYLQNVAEATPGEIAKKVGVPRPTVSQVLQKLLRLQRVERLGAGRTTRYRKC
jgi:Fic family protein